MYSSIIINWVSPGVRSDFYFFLSHFSMKFLCANRGAAFCGAPSGAHDSVCLCPTKKDTRLKCVKEIYRLIK